MTDTPSLNSTDGVDALTSAYRVHGTTLTSYIATLLADADPHTVEDLVGEVWLEYAEHLDCLGGRDLTLDRLQMTARAVVRRHLERDDAQLLAVVPDTAVPLRPTPSAVVDDAQELQEWELELLQHGLTDMPRAAA